MAAAGPTYADKSLCLAQQHEGGMFPATCNQHRGHDLGPNGTPHRSKDFSWGKGVAYGETWKASA